MSEQLNVLIMVVKALAVARIPYMLSGSVAMTFHTTPRMTRDIDIVIELDARRSAELVELFEADFYVDDESVRLAVSGQGMFNMLHNETLMKVDFIVRKDTEYRRTEFARRQAFTLGDTSIDVVSVEDLILSKLIWSKDSNSEIQSRDVRALLAAGDEVIDRPYIERWASLLGVDGQLAGAAS